jgi:murein DD-endopeptidase MepM/ murein hydrolase activator NlpD
MIKHLISAAAALAIGTTVGAIGEPIPDDFKVTATEMSGVISLKLSNTSAVPRFYHFQVKSSANVDVGAITKIDKVVSGGATVPLMVVSKIDPAQPTQLDYECTSEAAENAPPEPPRLVRSATPDWKYLYQVPAAPGAKTTVYAGYNSPETHAGVHALDFDLPFGTPVHAMRGGRVIQVISGQKDNPLWDPAHPEIKPSSLGYANIVTIRPWRRNLGSLCPPQAVQRGLIGRL